MQNEKNNDKSLRIFFAGTPECAIPALRILAKKHRLCGILTNPPAAVGRSRKKTPSPVMQAFLDLQEEDTRLQSVPVFTPFRLDKEARQSIAKTGANLLVCFAYGKIFSKAFLELFEFGGINIHPSLLPLYRGAAPVAASLLAGDTETGISIQKLAQEMDCGDILLQKKLPIPPQSTTESLLAICAEEAAVLLDKVLMDFFELSANAIKQDDSRACYCSLLKKEDGRIDWENSAEFIERQVRAFTPWPGTFTYSEKKQLRILETSVYSLENASLGNETEAKKFGTILGVDEDAGILVQTGKGVLAISRLQWQTKKALFWKDFLNGAPDFLNTILE